MMNKEYKQTNVKVGLTYEDYLTIMVVLDHEKKVDEKALSFKFDNDHSERRQENIDYWSNRIDSINTVIGKLKKMKFPYEDIINA